MVLPDIVKGLLDRGEERITRATRPSWLLSAFDAEEWFIKVPGQTRKVDGKWKGAIRLQWKTRLPGGWLTDSDYARLLTQCRLLTIAHLECPDAGCQTPRTMDSFYRFLIALAEHLVIHYPRETKTLGLHGLSPSKAERFLGDHLHHGRAGCGNWLGRWDAFLLARYRDPAEQARVSAWASRQQPERLIEINDLNRPLQTLDPKGFAPMKATLDIDRLRFARCWLVMKGWLDEAGCVPLERVAEAIGVNFFRVSKTSAPLRFHLRQYELCRDYRSQEMIRSTITGHREKLGHRHQSIAYRYYHGASGNTQRLLYINLGYLRRYAVYIDDLTDSCLPSLDLEQRIPLELRGDSSGRTPTLPVETALYIYDRMIHWALRTTRPLLRYYQTLLEALIARQGHAGKVNSRIPALEANGFEVPEDPWETAFLENPPPAELAELNLIRAAAFCTYEQDPPRLPEGGSALPMQLREHLSVEDALRLNTAVLAGLVAALCTRRHDEILTLHRDSPVEQSGLTYLDFGLCKVQLDGVRAPILRPLPRVLYKALCEQRELAEALCLAYGTADPLRKRRLFVVPSRGMGCQILARNTLNAALDLFCDYIEVPCDQHGRRWYLRLHECRRFFSMSFFHLHGAQTSLPALSWMMGHSDIAKTWRYIQEELTGKEITKAEVAMAHAAIQGKGEAEGAERLSRILRRHFKTDRLDLIDEEELVEYLEMLHEEGRYRVTPHSIKTTDGGRYTVVIAVAEALDRWH